MKQRKKSGPHLCSTQALFTPDPFLHSLMPHAGSALQRQKLQEYHCRGIPSDDTRGNPPLSARSHCDAARPTFLIRLSVSRPVPSSRPCVPSVCMKPGSGLMRIWTQCLRVQGQQCPTQSVRNTQDFRSAKPDAHRTRNSAP